MAEGLRFTLGPWDSLSKYCKIDQGLADDVEKGKSCLTTREPHGHPRGLVLLHTLMKVVGTLHFMCVISNRKTEVGKFLPH